MFVPLQLGIDMLAEDNRPSQRATYRCSPAGSESVVEESVLPTDESEDYWDLASFPGAYVHVARQIRYGTPAPTIPCAIASQRVWEVHPVCYSMRFRGDEAELVHYHWSEVLNDPSLESDMGHDPLPWVGYTWFYDPRFVDENLGGAERAPWITSDITLTSPSSFWHTHAGLVPRNVSEHEDEGGD